MNFKMEFGRVRIAQRLWSTEAEPESTSEGRFTVATFKDGFESAVARGALEAAGIPAIAPDERFGSFSQLNRRAYAELRV